MFETGCEFIMWQTYRDRLREGETNRLVRQVKAGQRRGSHFLAWARAWLGHRQPALRTGQPIPLHAAAKQATTDSKRAAA